MEAAHFLHPGAGHSPRPPHRLHPLLPDPPGNLEEHGGVRVTHGFLPGGTGKALDGEFLPLAMAVL